MNTMDLLGLLVFGSTFAFQIKCHSKPLDLFEGKKIRVVVVVVEVGGEGSWETECAIKQI